MTIGIVLFGSFLGAGQSYEWPLDLPKVLTSSFAEYRPGRFHAGIDLRTGGIGIPVHAPADGHVSRVRCSPWGYGKAVYVALDDGNTVVFGHLDGFDDRLTEYVRAAQHRLKSYTVDLRPEPGQFPVQRGQVVARSGDTGIGVAHLHYEIRDARERPLNPCLVGVTWPDSTRPVLRKVLVVPYGPGSTVQGDLLPVTTTVRQVGPGQYACDPVFASGRVGFGFDVIDPANSGASRLGVHALEATVGDETLFRIQHDRLSYDTMRDGVVAYHPFFLEEGRFLLGYRWPGNDSESYRNMEGPGWLEVAHEAVEVRVEARDFLGNDAVVTIPVRPEPERHVRAPAQAELGAGKVELDCLGGWVVLTARFTGPEPEPPVLNLLGSDAGGGPFRRVDDRTFRAGYSPSRGDRHVTVQVNHPRIERYAAPVEVFQRGDRERTASFGELVVTVPTGSPYGVLLLWEAPPGKLPQTPVPMVSQAYRLAPEDMPVDEPVRLELPLPKGVDKPERLGIYRGTRSGWSYQTTERIGDRLAIKARAFGTFAVLEDDQPPTITELRIGSKKSGITRRSWISAKVKDVGSGLGDITVTCGGQWLLMEYDPDTGQIEWLRDENLPAGKQTLVLRVSDRAGNLTEVSRALTVPTG